MSPPLMARVKRCLAHPALRRLAPVGRDAFAVFMYYYVGIAVLKRLEEWHTGKTIYFLSMTLTTVGFGDVAPTTVAGKWFVTAYAPAGIVLVFSIIARYMSAAALALLGVRVVDTRSLPIDEYRPRDVSRVVKYWKRYLLAAAPVALLLAGFVVGVAEFRKGDDELECSSRSDGGNFLRDEDVCDFGPTPSDLEEMLLDKYAALSAEDERAGAEPALSEADYVVATLVKADIVDDQILFAIRRNFHWDALAGATKFSTMITAEDVHALPKRPSSAQLWVPASLRGSGRAPPDDEPYDAWRARYWEPRLAARRAERSERRRELRRRMTRLLRVVLLGAVASAGKTRREKQAGAAADAPIKKTIGSKKGPPAWWNLGHGIGCPFFEAEDPGWHWVGPRGAKQTCNATQKKPPEKRARLCRQTGASGVAAADACPNACVRCCAGASFLDASPGPRCDAVAREFADAAAAAATLESFCDDPPPRRHDDANRTHYPGPRVVESACFGIFQEAHVSASPGDAALSRDMQASCCNYQILNRGRRNASAIIRGTIEDTRRYLMFPRSQIEAARHYAATSTRDVDLNFMGRLYDGDGDDGASLLDYALRKDYDPVVFSSRVAARMRAWVLPFVKRYFTADSVLLDTSVKDAATHVPLGAYDRSVGGDGALAGFRPIALNFTTGATTCKKATCDPAYYEKLARSRFTLAPAGDMPWSLRFFEAVMAGSVPILSSKEHAGRNHAEKTLGYKYLLVSEYVARRTRFPGAAPYCAEWADHNLAIFLEHQSDIEDPATVRPRLDRCLAEGFA
ncbi:potassium channel [Aureococcus anophagefferens]|nr:potassium channel [Aureococcus anophagefferens]